MPGVAMPETHAEVSPVKEIEKKKKSKKEGASEGKEKEVVKKTKSKKKEEEESRKGSKKGTDAEADGNGDGTRTKKRKKSDAGESTVGGETEEDAAEVPKKKLKSGKSSKSGEKKADSKTSDDVEVSEKDDDSKNAEENLSEEEFDPLSVNEFRISDGIRQKLASKGIKSLFPIQAKTFDIIFEGGDIVARARTGQGKTLAFVLPILNRMQEDKSSNKVYQRLPTVLVLAPTRELAKQVAQDFEYFSDVVNLTTLCVYGGVPIPPQENALRRGVDVVVGTPGRIKDLIERGRLNLSQIKYRVLDEADEMLNMGFVDDVELILGKVEDTEKVQTLLFSATMPDWVNKISQRFFKPNKTVVDLVGNERLKANENIKHYALRCNWSQKSQIVTDVIRCYGKDGRVIVFTETKRDCDELVKDISHASAFAIHGDVSQNVRETTLEGFRSGKFKVLVATDVAARGLDISDVELVIQIEPPRTEETYIHRSGRTGRAGNKGVSVMLFTPKKQYFVRTIERNCGIKFEYIGPPNTTDIVRASAHVAIESIKGVSDNAIDFFQEAAQNLINEGVSPVHLLAKAMAKIAGYSDLKERSLLTSQEDATTLYFKTDSQIRSPLYVISYLRRIMPDDAVNGVQKITMTKDKLGAVFDVPSSLADAFIQASQSDSEKSGPYAHTTLTKPNVLPELVYLGSEGNGYGNGARGGGYRGNGYGNGGGRSYGGRDGGARRGGDRRGGGRPSSRGRR